MSFPLYSLKLVPIRSARDPADRAKQRAKRATWHKIPQYRIVLRKERTIRAPRILVDGPDVAAEVAHGLIGDSPFEKLLTILINSANAIVGVVISATSSAISQTSAMPRGIFAAALAHNASAIVLAHNHPSGHVEPSREDLAFALTMEQQSNVLNVPILDHLIVTMDPARWRSFKP